MAAFALPALGTMAGYGLKGLEALFLGDMLDRILGRKPSKAVTKGLRLDELWDFAEGASEEEKMEQIQRIVAGRTKNKAESERELRSMFGELKERQQMEARPTTTRGEFQSMMFSSPEGLKGSDLDMLNASEMARLKRAMAAPSVPAGSQMSPRVSAMRGI